MRNIYLRVFLSAMCVASILAGWTTASAAPVRFDQVVQVINARPGKTDTGSIAQLRVVGDYSFWTGGDDDDKKADGPQDGRVITETKSDIVKDDVCDCEEPDHHHRGFPKWALLGLAAIPIAFIIIKHHDDTPTPTPSTTRTPNVTPSTTSTPHMTPSMTPTPMTPPPSPTPPQPVPEPVTILLFGTGLASIGLAARRKYGKKGSGEGEKQEN
jgi:PEP-CTERM motif